MRMVEKMAFHSGGSEGAHRRCHPSHRLPRGVIFSRVQPKNSLLRGLGSSLLRAQQAGIVAVLVVLSIGLALAAGTHPDRVTGAPVNNFLNAYTLIQVATDASGIAIMGVGATIVIISGGIDLSVGAIYALAGVVMAMVLRAAGPMAPGATVLLGLTVCLGIGALSGLANGLMVIGLGVHPFVITLGTMWMLRGLAFVISHAESILVPPALTELPLPPIRLAPPTTAAAMTYSS